MSINMRAILLSLPMVSADRRFAEKLLVFAFALAVKTTLRKSCERFACELNGTAKTAA